MNGDAAGQTLSRSTLGRALTPWTAPLKRAIERTSADGLGATARAAGRFCKWRVKDSLYLPFLGLVSDDGLVSRQVNGQQMHLALDDPGISRRLLVRGEHEPAIAERWVSYLEEGMTVVDVGGNLGYYTLLAADTVGDAGHVHSIEPHPRNYDLLRRNVAANDHDNISTYNEAVAATTGTKPMYLTAESNWGTLTEWGEESQVSDYMAEKMREATEETIRVRTTSLDEFVAANDLATVDAIRMDLEGFETEVLAGMHRLLSELDAPCWLFLEVHNKLFEDHERVVGDLVETYLDAGFEPVDLLVGNEAVAFEPGEFLETLLEYEHCCPHVVLKL